jgi:hypothetical protein
MRRRHAHYVMICWPAAPMRFHTTPRKSSSRRGELGMQIYVMVGHRDADLALGWGTSCSVRRLHSQTGQAYSKSSLMSDLQRPQSWAWIPLAYRLYESSHCAHSHARLNMSTEFSWSGKMLELRYIRSLTSTSSTPFRPVLRFFKACFHEFVPMMAKSAHGYLLNGAAGRKMRFQMCRLGDRAILGASQAQGTSRGAATSSSVQAQSRGRPPAWSPQASHPARAISMFNPLLIDKSPASL